MKSFSLWFYISWKNVFPRLIIVMEEAAGYNLGIMGKTKTLKINKALRIATCRDRSERKVTKDFVTLSSFHRLILSSGPHAVNRVQQT